MAGGAPRTWFPRWVRSLGGPAWVVAPDRTIRWMNRPMRSLLGGDGEWRGRPCWEVIRGRDPRGRRRCASRCAPLSDVMRNRPVAPGLVAIGTDPVRWLHVLTIALRAPDGSFPWLVHGAASCDGPEHPARRSAADGRPSRHPKLDALTRREREVVRLLCRGESLHGIADALGVRYVTVRNHVQHIEAKLGVHSLLEIVALGLARR